MKINGTVSVFADEVDMEQIKISESATALGQIDNYLAIKAAQVNEQFLRLQRLCDATDNGLIYLRTIQRLVPRGLEVVFRIAPKDQLKCEVLAMEDSDA